MNIYRVVGFVLGCWILSTTIGDLISGSVSGFGAGKIGSDRTITFNSNPIEYVVQIGSYLVIGLFLVVGSIRATTTKE